MASQNDSAALQSLMLSLCFVKCCLILYALSLQIGHFQVPSLNSVGKFRKVGHTTLVRESSECSGRLSEVVEGLGGSLEWLVVEVPAEASNVVEEIVEEIEKELSENVGWSGPPPLFSFEDT